MDVKIDNKDTALDGCGNCVYINSVSELAQRVKIACTVKKGDFLYDRQLGRNACSISADDPMLKEKLEMIFKEATIDIPYTDLSVLSADSSKGVITAKIKITCGSSSATTEVEVNG